MLEVSAVGFQKSACCSIDKIVSKVGRASMWP